MVHNLHKESERGNSHKTQPKQHKQGQRSRNTGSVDAYNKKHRNQRRTKNQRTPEEAMVYGNNSRIEMHQSQ